VTDGAYLILRGPYRIIDFFNENALRKANPFSDGDSSDM